MANDLIESDLPSTEANLPQADRRRTVYPLALVKATAIARLFSGLRSDELVRLRVGCIRWQRSGDPAAATSHTAGDGATCLLDVPTHKTGASFTKPVDSLMRDAIGDWEACRPDQPLMIDRKTGERVAMLFCFRGRSLHTGYFNETLIPILCRKASLPLERQSDIRCAIEWTTLGEYLDFLVERGVACNVASFVGATSVRVHEVGYADRPQLHTS